MALSNDSNFFKAIINKTGGWCPSWSTTRLSIVKLFSPSYRTKLTRSQELFFGMTVPAVLIFLFLDLSVTLQNKRYRFKHGCCSSESVLVQQFIPIQSFCSCSS